MLDQTPALETGSTAATREKNQHFSADGAVRTPPAGSRFAGALRAVRSAQKPGQGVPAYTRWVNRTLAQYAAAAGFVLGWSPNGVTVLSFVLSLAGITVLVVLPPALGLAAGAAALMALGYVLDSADGQLARLQKRGGPAGEWFDHVADALRGPVIHIGVAVALFRHDLVNDEFLLIPLLFAAVTSAQFMSQILAEQLRRNSGAATRRTGSTLQSWILLPTDPGVLFLIFVTWAAPPLFVSCYAALLLIAIVHAGVSARRRYLELSQVSSR
jgi:phosphatidylglycerophosphate synthase